MDFSSLVDSVDFSGVDAAVLAIAAVVIAVFAIEWGVRKVLALVGGGDGYDSQGFSSDDYWNGYTAEDDARDRAAAGLGPNPNWAESADIQSDPGLGGVPARSADEVAFMSEREKWVAHQREGGFSEAFIEREAARRFGDGSAERQEHQRAGGF
ncbi:hypothetical protein GmRootV118_24690 [Variovorax sp. V118]|uniref:hypothetical protein n=1 Tax=Variovorax sp. V118 TaxID=3065954 RepID=UPI0034E85A2E